MLASATTQTSGGGMMSWTVGEWFTFFGILTTFIGVTLTPAIITILGKIGDLKTKVTSAQVTADSAKAESVTNTNRLFTMAQNSPPPYQQVPTSPSPTILLPAATPEAIAKAFALHNATVGASPQKSDP